MGWHIRETTLVPAMDAPGQLATARALGPSTESMGRNNHFIRLDSNVIYDKAGRQQPGSLPGFGHEQLSIAISCDEGTDLPHRLHRE